MNTLETITIPLSKRKMAFMLLGAVIFVILGVLFVIDPDQYISRGKSSSIIFITGVASILFFGTCAFFIFRKLTETSPGLVIDHIGLIDNSSGIAVRRIFWNDIRGLSVREIHKQKLIMLTVDNPQEYIDKEKSSFKKRLMKINFDMYGTPLCLTSNTLQIPFDELMSTLDTYLKTTQKSL